MSYTFSFLSMPDVTMYLPRERRQVLQIALWWTLREVQLTVRTENIILFIVIIKLFINVLNTQRGENRKIVSIITRTC